MKISAALLILISALCTFAFFKFGMSGGVPQDPQNFLQAPGAQHWFGTDSLGRDLLWRTFLGGFYSILVGVIAATVSLIFSFFLVVFFEIFFPRLSGTFIRLLDIVQSIPSFILVTLVCLFVPGTAIVNLTLSIALVSWMSAFRLLRGYAKQMMSEGYIAASRSLGASSWSIARTHLLLYLRSPLLHLWLLLVPQSILYESSLSFIGLGLQSPQTSWGLLVQEGWRTIAAYPYPVFFPVLLLALVSLAMQNLLQKEAHI